MDFIITWVDGNDPEWRKEYLKAKGIKEGDDHVARFRDWDNLEYWFRGVEKFAPWVDKIHFVTWGHLPKWLNTEHPKLNIVKHEDFIPHKYLPTFNSRTIDLNFHRIPELSEEFVYFNDDTFLIDKVNPEHFFRNGLPCDKGACVAYTGNDYSFTLFKNISVIRNHFSKLDKIKEKPFNWFNIKYGRTNIMNLLLLITNRKYHSGFDISHLPKPLLKKTVKTLWEKEPAIMDEASKNTFRNLDTVNEYLQRYWQLASNNFYPINTRKLGTSFQLGNDENNLLKATTFIKEQKKPMICINDQPSIDEGKFQKMKEEIKVAFDKILPEKSNFEK